MYAGLHHFIKWWPSTTLDEIILAFEHSYIWGVCSNLSWSRLWKGLNTSRLRCRLLSPPLVSTDEGKLSAEAPASGSKPTSKSSHRLPRATWSRLKKEAFHASYWSIQSWIFIPDYRRFEANALWIIARSISCLFDQTCVIWTRIRHSVWVEDRFGEGAAVLVKAHSENENVLALKFELFSGWVRKKEKSKERSNLGWVWRKWTPPPSPRFPDGEFSSFIIADSRDRSNEGTNSSSISDCSDFLSIHGVNPTGPKLAHNTEPWLGIVNGGICGTSMIAVLTSTH